MQDPDNNTIESLLWSDPVPIADGATSCSATLKNGCNLTEVTDAEGKKRVHYVRELINPNLRPECAIEAAQLYYDHVSPSILQSQANLGSKPDPSQPGSCKATQAWLARKSVLDKEYQFTADYMKIYQPHDNGEFMPKKLAGVEDLFWRLTAKALYANDKPTEDNQTDITSISGLVPATVL